MNSTDRANQILLCVPRVAKILVIFFAVDVFVKCYSVCNEASVSYLLLLLDSVEKQTSVLKFRC